MGERAKFVGKFLADRVLKGVGIDRVETDPERGRALGELPTIVDLVPWEMRRAGWGCPVS